jgi:hypothetical protein
MPSKLPARLRTFDFPLDTPRPAFVADVRATLLDTRNRKSPLLKGLMVLGQKAGEALDEKAPIILGYSKAYPDAQNALAAWSGTATYLGRAQRTFGGNAYALTHGRNLNGTTASYQSTFSVPRNTPFAMRLFQMQPHESIPFAVCGVRFGQWTFQIADKKGEIALRKSTWTQSIEDNINSKRALDGYDAEIDDLRATYYDIYKTLPGGDSFNGGTFYDVVFIPESRGALNVLVTTDGADELTRIVVPDLANQRGTDLTVYDATTLTVFGNGPAFVWQAGYPQFAASGSFEFPFQFVATPGDGIDEFAEMTRRANIEAPTGTTVAIDLPDVGPYGEDGARKYALSVVATTTDTRRTPFLYGVQVVQPALPRSGWDGDESYDSDAVEWELAAGIGPIEDVTMECEGDGWERTYTVVIRDPYGQSLPHRRLMEALEGRHARIDINGFQVLGRGLVTGADRSSARGVEYNWPTSASVWGPDTTSILKISDGWALLDEHLIADDMVLDGLTLGEAVRLLLRNAGYSTTEVANVPVGFGRVLPVAQLDEEPCVMVKREEDSGGALRDLMTKWGLGARLWHNYGGTWTLEMPSDESVLTLSRDATSGSRLRVYGPLDFNRDYGESYNYFLVKGGLDAYGQPIWVSWNEYGGYRWGSNAQQNFIGRVRRYPTVEDEGLRTKADALYVLRSLRERFGRPGRFLSFQTAYHPELLPGVSFTIGRLATTPESIHPLRCRVSRVSGANARDDMMTVVAQEKVQRYGVGE